MAKAWVFFASEVRAQYLSNAISSRRWVSVSFPETRALCEDLLPMNRAVCEGLLTSSASSSLWIFLPLSNLEHRWEQ